jgi:hypothetical protein
MNVCVMSTETLIEATVAPSAMLIVSCAPVGLLSGMLRAGDEVFLMIEGAGAPILPRVSATAAAASTLP